jgi:hypothetical protein
VFFVQTRPNPDREASYQPVAARCGLESSSVRIWLDEACGDELSPADIVWFAQCLEGEILPRIGERFGTIADVDGDGKLSVCITARLAELPGAESPVEGLVQANDFAAGMPRPFSNQSDVLFLSPSLRPGPRARAILAHEAAHLAIFSRRRETAGAPEDDWLNEGLAHFAEIECAGDWSNLEGRLAAYAVAPGEAPLVVVDARQQGLWRHAGARGAGWLFLAWLADAYGPELIGRLAREGDAGCEKLERLTHEPFAELFRRWSIAAWTSSATTKREESIRLASFSDSAPSARLTVGLVRCGGLQVQPLTAPGRQTEFSVRGTAVQGFGWRGPSARIRIVTSSGSRLQVTVIERSGGVDRIETIQ